METIKKTINITDFKSRSFGLMHHISSETGEIVPSDGKNGNWGEILCDYSDYGDTTANLIAKYHKLIKILWSGAKLKKLEKNGSTYYTDKFDDDINFYRYTPQNEMKFRTDGNHLYWEVLEEGETGTSDAYIMLVSEEDYETYTKLGGFNLINKVEGGLFGLITLPKYITGARVPERFYLSQIDAWLKWFQLNKRAAKNVPVDCCVLQEWNDRGGDAMYSFLKSKRATYLQELDKWKNAYEQCKLSAPKINIPILLTQSYEDLGVLSIYDETIPYNGGPMSVTGTFNELSGTPSAVKGYYSSLEALEKAVKIGEIRPESGDCYQAGDEYYKWDDTTDHVVESKLASFRSKEKLFDDESNVLPYILDSEDSTDGKIPYKVGEGFNVRYIEKEGKHVADYIDNINEISGGDDIYDGYLEFEYVMGGDFDPSAAQHLAVSPSVLNLDYDDTATTVTLSLSAENKTWIVISRPEWVSNITPSSGTNGDTTVTINTTVNPNDYGREGTIIFGLSTRFGYEEVSLTIKQAEQPVVSNISFEQTKIIGINFDKELSATARYSDGTTRLVLGLTVEEVVTCTDSDWGVESIPSWMTATPSNGRANTRTSVSFTAGPNTSRGSRTRTGQVVLAALADPEIKRIITVQQTGNITPRNESN